MSLHMLRVLGNSLGHRTVRWITATLRFRHVARSAQVGSSQIDLHQWLW